MTNQSKNTRSSIDLKNALFLDLEKLKHLDLGIIPAGTYYARVFLGWLFLLMMIMGIESMACFFAMKNNAWEYAPHTHWNEFGEIIEDSLGNGNDIFREQELRMKFSRPLTRPLPGHMEMRYLSEEEQQKIEQKIQEEKRTEQAQRLERKKARKAKFEEQRQKKHERQVASMILGVFLSSMLISFFGLRRIKNYLIFNYQIRPQLQTGNFLIQKIHWAIIGFFSIFGLLSVLFIPLFEQGIVFFSALPGLIGAAAATRLLINLEASRIGVSVLFQAIFKFFNKNKEGALDA